MKRWPGVLFGLVGLGWLMALAPVAAKEVDSKKGFSFTVPDGNGWEERRNFDNSNVYYFTLKDSPSYRFISIAVMGVGVEDMPIEEAGPHQEDIFLHLHLTKKDMSEVTQLDGYPVYHLIGHLHVGDARHPQQPDYEGEAEVFFAIVRGKTCLFECFRTGPGPVQDDPDFKAFFHSIKFQK